MKQRYETVIDADRDSVWAAFDNPDNLARWQPTLASYRHKAGDPGRPGAIAELVYRQKDREVVMTETITERRRPDFMAGTYETRFGKTLIVNTFDAIEPNRTRWTAWTNMRFTGLTRLFSPFLVGSIRRRTESDMARFKLMVETDAVSSAS